MTIFSIMLGTVEKLKIYLEQENWVQMVELVGTWEVLDETEFDIKYLKVTTTSGMLFEIHQLWNPFEVKGADDITLGLIAVFFAKYGFLPT